PSRLTPRLLEALDDAADAAGPRGAGPDDVVVDWIGNGEAALAPGDRIPHGPRNDAAHQAAVARPGERRPVLAVAVHVVRNLVVDVRVIHLGDRELDAPPAPTPVDGDIEGAVVPLRDPTRVRRIDPYRVIVAARRRHGRSRLARESAVER